MTKLGVAPLRAALAGKGGTRRQLRGALEGAADCLVLRRLPHGFSPYYDLKRRVPEMSVIVDVGANVGQTAAALTATWPSASVLCVEPFAETFATLVRNTATHERVTCVQRALGATGGTVDVYAAPRSVNNSLANRADAGEAPAGTARETVTVTTFDELREERGIDHVDFLKIDTEGHDLEVLRGATGSLTEQRVTFVQVEAGMTRHNAKHVPFHEVVRAFEEVGYVLFGIYDQTPEWDGEARLRFTNPVFVAETKMGLPAAPLSISAVRASLPRR